MYYVTEYPYFKTTGISLFLHGALLVALLVLRPFAATQPPVITAVEIISVTEPAAPESAAAVSEASPPPAPPAMAQPTPQTPAPAQPLSPMVPDELSTTPATQPVFAGATAAAGEPSAFAATGISGGSGTMATATGSGTQVGTQGNGSGERTRGSLIYAPKPRYPQAARRDGWEGNVLLQIRVETDGSVTVLSVLEGGRSDIEESAVEAVNKRRYSPDRDENGEPVVAIKNIRIKFNLNDVE